MFDDMLLMVMVVFAALNLIVTIIRAYIERLTLKHTCSKITKQGQIGYIAGILDGEGTVTLYKVNKNYTSIGLSVSNTDLNLMKELVALVPKSRFSITNCKNKKPMFKHNPSPSRQGRNG